MTKTKYQSANSFKFNPARHAYRNNAPSETVPNQSFTIVEILQKFTRGIDPMLTKNGSYEFEGDQGIDMLDENIDIIDSLDDITQATNLLNAIQDRVQVLRKEKEEAEKLKENSAS
jgi:hypothetical protein